jgi:hypothetical protein
MRSPSKAVLAFGALALLAHAAAAQQPPGGPFGGGLQALLLSKDVQKELKLSDEQVAKAMKLAQEMVQKYGEELILLRMPVAGLGGEEGKIKKQVELSRKVTDEMVEGMGDSLKPEQVKRFRQLALQQTIRTSGAGVFLDPEVDKALKPSDKQKEELKSITDDLQKKQQDVVKQAKGNYLELFKKLAAVNKESMESAEKLLNEDQKKTWKDLTGEPFEFKTGLTPVPPSKSGGED